MPPLLELLQGRLGSPKHNLWAYTEQVFFYNTHRWFNHIRQVASMCTPSSTPQSASTPHQFCPLLSRFEHNDHWICGHLLGRPLVALKTAPSRVWISTLSNNTWLLELTRVNIPNGIMIGSVSFAGLMVATDRPHYSVCSNRPHQASAVMHPNNYSVTGHLSFLSHLKERKGRVFI